MKINKKRLVAVIHDASMSGAALLVAIIARYGFNSLPSTELLAAWISIFVLISALVFKVLGLGRGLWRFASLSDLRAIIIASTVTIIVFVLCLFLMTRLDSLPRSVPFITWFVMIVLIGAPRLAYRAFKDGSLSSIGSIAKPKAETTHVLLAGHIRDAEKVIRTHHLDANTGYSVHALTCDDASKTGHSIRGIPILGEVSKLDELIKRLHRSGKPVDAILSVTDRPDTAFAETLTRHAAEFGIPIKRATPRPLDLSEPDFSELTIDDLLGRAPVRLDTSRLTAMIEGRVILVTGAGGSIGSEVVRQILKYGPKRLILLENSEFALYKVDQEVAKLSPQLARRAVIADVRDRSRITKLVKAECPDIIFHAAALKHVPLVEDNPLEALLTNIVGTRNVADAAVAAKSAAFVLISTDKAVKPTSVMGATKRAAEGYCQALDVSQETTRFITVRFGNVLGSNGSVIPLFRKQIEAGGPLTVTHPEMRRYFMTIPEASELVLQAAAIRFDNSNQRGRIYVLDMGDPVKIVDLANILVSLAGLRPGKDIQIQFTGLRPGEKMFEEIFEADEDNLPSGADGVVVATARIISLDIITRIIDRLELAASDDDVFSAIDLLVEIAPTLAQSLNTNSA